MLIYVDGTLLWATYYGRNESDSVYGIAIDNDNDLLYFSGDSFSVGLGTPNAQFPNRFGGLDAIVGSFWISDLTNGNRSKCIY